MLRTILIAATLTLVGCSSKEKSSDSKSNTQQSVKASKDKSPSKNNSKIEVIKTVTCSYNNDNRKISSVKSSNGACEVHYEKFGEKKTVATAKYNLDYCSQMANKVSNNLEEAGFTCK